MTTPITAAEHASRLTPTFLEEVRLTATRSLNMLARHQAILLNPTNEQHQATASEMQQQALAYVTVLASKELWYEDALWLNHPKLLAILNSMRTEEVINWQKVYAIPEPASPLFFMERYTGPCPPIPPVARLPIQPGPVLLPPTDPDFGPAIPPGVESFKRISTSIATTGGTNQGRPTPKAAGKKRKADVPEPGPKKARIVSKEFIETSDDESDPKPAPKPRSKSKPRAPSAATIKRQEDQNKAISEGTYRLASTACNTCIKRVDFEFLPCAEFVKGGQVCFTCKVTKNSCSFSTKKKRVKQEEGEVKIVKGVGSGKGKAKIPTPKSDVEMGTIPGNEDVEMSDEGVARVDKGKARAFTPAIVVNPPMPTHVSKPVAKPQYVEITDSGEGDDMDAEGEVDPYALLVGQTVLPSLPSGGSDAGPWCEPGPSSTPHIKDTPGAGTFITGGNFPRPTPTSKPGPSFTFNSRRVSPPQANEIHVDTALAVAKIDFRSKSPPPSNFNMEVVKKELSRLAQGQTDLQNQVRDTQAQVNTLEMGPQVREFTAFIVHRHHIDESALIDMGQTPTLTSRLNDLEDTTKKLNDQRAPVHPDLVPAHIQRLSDLEIATRKLQEDQQDFLPKRYVDESAMVINPDGLLTAELQIPLSQRLADLEASTRRLQIFTREGDTFGRPLHDEIRALADDAGGAHERLDNAFWRLEQVDQLSRATHALWTGAHNRLDAQTTELNAMRETQTAEMGKLTEEQKVFREEMKESVRDLEMKMQVTPAIMEERVTKSMENMAIRVDLSEQCNSAILASNKSITDQYIQLKSRVAHLEKIMLKHLGQAEHTDVAIDATVKLDTDMKRDKTTTDKSTQCDTGPGTAPGMDQDVAVSTPAASIPGTTKRGTTSKLEPGAGLAFPPTQTLLAPKPVLARRARSKEPLPPPPQLVGQRKSPRLQEKEVLAPPTKATTNDDAHA